MKECIDKSNNLKSYYCFFSGDNCGIQNANIFFRKLSNSAHLIFDIQTEYTKSSLVNLNILYNDVYYKIPFNSFIIFNLLDKTLEPINKSDFETHYQIK